LGFFCFFWKIVLYYAGNSISSLNFAEATLNASGAIYTYWELSGSTRGVSDSADTSRRLENMSHPDEHATLEDEYSMIQTHNRSNS